MAYTSALEVALEMGESVGARSITTGTSEPLRYRMQFNAADFDAATYYFEIDWASNADAAPRNVILRDITNGADKATISVTNGLAGSRLRSTSFSPVAGEVVYSVTMPQSTVEANVQINGARVVVVQTSAATKTVIDIPMLNAKMWDGDTSVNATSGECDASTTYNQGTGREHQFYRFAKTASNWATVSGCALDMVYTSGWSDETATLALVNVTDANAEVTGATQTDAHDAVPTHYYKTFNWSDMHDGDNFEVMLKSSSTGYTPRFCRCSLRIKLSDLEKGEIHRYIGKSFEAATGAGYNHACRRLYTTANVTTPTVYLEATGYCADNAVRVSLYQINDDTTEDSGAAVASGTINFNSATKARQRSAAVTPTTGYRVFPYHTASTANKAYFAHLIVAFAGAYQAPPFTGLTVTHRVG